MYGLPTSDKSKGLYSLTPVRKPTTTIFQDRSLGSVELQISPLAKESGDPQYRYESTVVKEATDPIRLEKGDVYKGHLQYTATFIPALAVKGIKFEAKQSEIAPGRGRGNNATDDSSSISSSDDEAHAIPAGVTIKLPSKDVPKDGPKAHVTTKSTDSGQSSQSSQANDAARTPGTSTPNEGVEMTTDELLTHRTSGVSIMPKTC
jgi:hypothetical protein